MMEPLLESIKSYTTQICIKVNHELRDYTNNAQFRNYLNNEIGIQFNSREETNATTQLILRRDKCNNSPDFQIKFIKDLQQ